MNAHLRSRGKRKRRRRAPPGASPGTLVIDPEAPPPIVTAMAYGPAEFVEQPVRGTADIPPLLARWPVTWINVDGFGDVRFLEEIQKIFGLHRLAIEDVVNVHQRAKVEPYGETLFIVCRMVLSNPELTTEQVSLFLGKGFVLTFQERQGDCFDPVRDRIRKGQGRMRGAGPDYLAYALLDALTDHIFPIMESMGERLDQLEDEVMERPEPETVRLVHGLRRDLLLLRRSVWPLREALALLYRDPLPLITDETRIYLRDCYDHAVQIMDMVESSREVAAGLMEFYLSSLSHRMNEIMKVLAIFAAIFIPLSFVAGLYGMNFNPDRSPWNMPELDWYFGYPFALMLMGIVAGSMLLYFRRQGWLGPAPRRKSRATKEDRPPSPDDGSSG